MDQQGTAFLEIYWVCVISGGKQNKPTLIYLSRCSYIVFLKKVQYKDHLLLIWSSVATEETGKVWIHLKPACKLIWTKGQTFKHISQKPVCAQDVNVSACAYGRVKNAGKHTARVFVHAVGLYVTPAKKQVKRRMNDVLFVHRVR